MTGPEGSYWESSIHTRTLGHCISDREGDLGYGSQKEENAQHSLLVAMLPLGIANKSPASLSPPAVNNNHPHFPEGLESANGPSEHTPGLAAM